jgi:hypothetical protein
MKGETQMDFLRNLFGKKQSDTNQPVEGESIATLCGTEIEQTYDSTIFIALCKLRRLAMLRITTEQFKQVKDALQSEMLRVYGQSSWFGAACDMRLFCPNCHIEFPNSYIETIDGTLDDINKRGGRTAGSGEISSALQATQEFRCYKCGAQEVLALYDNWDPVKIIPSDADALRQLWQARTTTKFWSEKLREGATCRMCGSFMSPASVFIVHAGHGGYHELCQSCSGELLNSAMEYLSQDAFYIGASPAELRDARNFVQGEYILR